RRNLGGRAARRRVNLPPLYPGRKPDVACRLPASQALTRAGTAAGHCRCTCTAGGLETLMADADRQSTGIRTPDQRLRVFVSSTLEELAAERAAARAAIEQLRMAPVMFESGARPHPAQAGDRAYLWPSDGFIW